MGPSVAEIPGGFIRFYPNWDKRWRSSHMFYLDFVSASKKHIDWLRSCLSDKLGVGGHITLSGNRKAYHLNYAKKEALVIIKKMYYNPDVVCLSRKKIKINKVIETERKQQLNYINAQVEKR